jgi:site-specific DNA recombinase
VEFVSEPLDNSPEGQLIRFVRGYAAKVEHEKIKERTMRGKRARVDAGKLLPGPQAPYGYQWDADKTQLTPDPASAPVVARIFAAVLRGATTRGIARQLMDDGIPRPSGTPGPWLPATLSLILANPLYAGRAQPWRWMRTKTANGKRSKVLRPVSDHAPAAHAVPSLVNEATFEAVRQRLEANKMAAPRNNKQPFETLLRGGYVRCGYCGRAMHAHAATQRGKRLVMYRCPSGGLPGATMCKHTVLARILDGAVWAN